MLQSERFELISSPVVAAAESHIGRVRKTNQDRFCLRSISDGSVMLAVADGLGGVPAGDIAADMILAALSQMDGLDIGLEEHQLADLAVRLDQSVAQARIANPELGGIGSTLNLVWLRNDWAFWVHVGDSRFYLLRDQRLQRITCDQTLARFLVDEGELTLEQSRDHYSQEVMHQCIGCGFCEPETGRIRLKAGDILLICSDGLYRYVAFDQLEAVLGSPADTRNKCRAVVQAALSNGGLDNITGIIAQVRTDADCAIKGEYKNGD